MVAAQFYTDTVLKARLRFLQTPIPKLRYEVQATRAHCCCADLSNRITPTGLRGKSEITSSMPVSTHERRRTKSIIFPNGAAVADSWAEARRFCDVQGNPRSIVEDWLMQVRTESRLFLAGMHTLQCLSQNGTTTRLAVS